MYDHKPLEEAIFKFWESEHIYEKQKECVKDKERVYFLDGPPYVTGNIHPGTGWNKTMKDILIRYYRMRGYNVRDTPGFDTHGLPIEVKVEQKLGFKNKQDIEKIGISRFIKECKDFANYYINLMTKQFKSLAIWMDWDNPYVTYKNDYIEKSWATLKKAHEKGLLYKGESVVPYCPRCQTTLANYELEYWDETDPSIYVKFKVKEETGKGLEGSQGQQSQQGQQRQQKPLYLIIWTTTPWTLVANMAVAANPNLTYVEVDVGEERWILLKDKLDEVLEKAETSGVVIREMDGSALEGLAYEHPLQEEVKKDYDRRVVLSETLVSAEEGSGLVHIAPGHGPEDFQLGQEKGIEAFSPVDDKGQYTSEAGVFAGKEVKAANPEIIALLKDKGLLLAEERITHRYPHCWRCKTPLIYIKTKQWFLKIGAVKDKMLGEAEKVVWVPNIARNRFQDLIKSAPDWCISRQRYWGIPLPIWVCEKCGHIKVVGSADELPVKLDDLHKPEIDKVELKCEKCGGTMKRVPDVLDVWFDSGNAVWASQDGEWGDTADYILEGHDQIRGWFYSLLGSGVVYHGKVPYKSVVMHGFFVDEKGEKMSKSLGNFIPLEEIVEKAGVDAFRLFGVFTNVWEDVKLSWNALKEAKEEINLYLNVISFMERHYTAEIHEKVKGLTPESLAEEDRWMLSRLHSTLAQYIKGLNDKELAKTFKLVRSLLIDDLSKRYMKLAKTRIAKDENKEGALYTLYQSIWYISLMLSPVVPLATEHAYQAFFKQFEAEKEGKEPLISIHLHQIPDEQPELIDQRLEQLGTIAFDIVSELNMLRNVVKVKLRWPLAKAFIKTEDADKRAAVKKFMTLIAKLANVKAVKILSADEQADEEVECNEDGSICLAKTLHEELWEEGMANEVIRRVQLVRKKLGLKEKNIVPIYLDGDAELMEIAKKFSSLIQKRTHASKLEFRTLEEDKAESFMIDGRPLLVRIEG